MPPDYERYFYLTVTAVFMWLLLAIRIVQILTEK